jgi:hypothetical protein
MGLSEQQSEEAPERYGRFGKDKNLLPLPGIEIHICPKFLPRQEETPRAAHCTLQTNFHAANPKLS